MVPLTFVGKITLDIDFTNEAVVQCDVLFVKRLVSDVNLQMITNKLRCECLMYCLWT